MDNNEIIKILEFIQGTTEAIRMDMESIKEEFLAINKRLQEIEKYLWAKINT